MLNVKATKATRIAAGIAGLMMLVIVLLSAFYVAAESGHNCSGDDCPICACIQQCERTLHGFSDGSVTQLHAVIPVFFVLLATALFAAAVAQDSLVSRKVRFNN